MNATRQFIGSTKLDQLRAMSIVVADTGDIDAVRRLRPIDCTTNPSLILKAFQNPANRDHVDEALEWGRKSSLSSSGVIPAVCDRLAINFGLQLSKLIPGRVSIEIDANLSFDINGSITKAHEIIDSFRLRGIERDRILIKLAATWEGIRAAAELQRNGIDCNLTLVFCMAQAIACAQANAFLISPFVGRIFDWHVKAGKGPFSIQTDPGIQSVRAIYNSYRYHDFKTAIMAASFRSQAQVEALAGCDRLTISTPLLDAMDSEIGVINRVLFPSEDRAPEPATEITESDFRWQLNSDSMAADKLSEGIRLFGADLETLRGLVAKQL